MVEEYKKYFTKVTFEQILRVQNKAADAMEIVGSPLDMPNDGTRFEFQGEQLIVPAYEIPYTEYVCMIVGPKPPWYKDIYAYLHDQYIPLDLSRNRRKALIRKSSKHAIIADTLYRKRVDSTLLRCLDIQEAQIALKKVHDGICGAHSSRPALAKTLL